MNPVRNEWTHGHRTMEKRVMEVRNGWQYDVGSSTKQEYGSVKENLGGLGFEAG
ncbi:hypothetical protein L195_g039671 [Trifolium pratense]|uniref:Uncharacterized protein n=1 Tax=Trifolium pratense TaxID=57577 RepID=A0A2K3LXQ3_TRIPR|nr:hypothetical protein L195_g053610 [Trifolium pratense]PNX83315.1 hypothetical protein L195_g039355 [Trifolium pratense]PNX83627.1 hypothetical protein L195_g039671 [Trifolium pratense]